MMNEYTSTDNTKEFDNLFDFSKYEIATIKRIIHRYKIC